MFHPVPLYVCIYLFIWVDSLYINILKSKFNKHYEITLYILSSPTELEKWGMFLWLLSSFLFLSTRSPPFHCPCLIGWSLKCVLTEIGLCPFDRGWVPWPPCQPPTPTAHYGNLAPALCSWMGALCSVVALLATLISRVWRHTVPLNESACCHTIDKPWM